MKAIQPQFNLVNDPWIPVVYDDATRAVVSLRESFEQASHIVAIVTDNPLQKAVLYRLFEAIWMRAYEMEQIDVAPSECYALWQEFWDLGEFDLEIINAYLNKYEAKFELFDSKTPFYQVPDLEYVGKKAYDGVETMILDVPKGTGLFSLRNPETLEGLDFAEAARQLLTIMAYDTAGIKSPVEGFSAINKGKAFAPQGVPSVGWLGNIGSVWAEGSNLFETIMLNWVISNPLTSELSESTYDRAPWELDTPPEHDLVVRDGFRGMVDALTVQSRRIRLVCNEAGTQVIGLVICYGDIIRPAYTQIAEMHTSWRVSKPKKGEGNAPVVMPRTFEAGKALWRSLGPLLVADSENSARPGVLRWLDRLFDEIPELREKHLLQTIGIIAQGMTYGTQSSVFEASYDDSLELSSEMLRSGGDIIGRVLDVVAATEQSVKDLGTFAFRLEVASGADSDSKNRRTDTRMQIAEEAYAALDGVFRERLAQYRSDDDALAYCKSWKDEIHRLLLRLAQDYLDQSPTQSFSFHEENGRRVDAGQAMLTLKYRLKENLGSLSEHSIPTEGEEDAPTQ
ncbi:type I-E CRISPR-associated protein Cse1/CasA [Bifidobacterium gallicum]|uniref:CRISPR system CASCADE complex protein CasA n=1 Tax=Bifidobacterium gallicum DSM 20093 = LMG 11596 TaxID=561180 RepID=D1NTH8_9BIFI|nr:type I-E CRISPR-associated protein Cse1/CasA [Bifidobacterium gallicum]EFA23032.1 CRISPR system CASCADE complex protein CasA [Bifidobacterium gallicum DSM 20093 = LMG 11596]KFI57660.1 CRISPR-associated protein, Cse1 family [Bifidobacterium gallicum DSM 20093 = LMG 11596]